MMIKIEPKRNINMWISTYLYKLIAYSSERKCLFAFVEELLKADICTQCKQKFFPTL